MDVSGPLAHTVATAGAVIAAATAIGLAWRGRASWEPSEQDLPNGPRRVGGLVAAVAIVLLWSQYTVATAVDQLKSIAVFAASLAVVALLAYGYLVATQTYKVVIAMPGNATQVKAIVGGFTLTASARKIQRSRNLTTQDLLAGAAYDPDRVWARIEGTSQALLRPLLSAPDGFGDRGPGDGRNHR